MKNHRGNIKSRITSHVLDTSIGKPAAGIKVLLELVEDADDVWSWVGNGTTDEDGRVPELANNEFYAGYYRITFQVADYFSSQKIKAFYHVVRIEFVVEADQHYHVPLLLNPFGYSTYRGS